jgi:sulfite exporter TauE/SafE
LVEDRLSKVPGVKRVNVTYTRGTAELKCSTRTDEREIENAVVAAGYRIGAAERPRWLSRSFRDYWEVGIAALVLLALYFIAKWTGVAGVSVDPDTFTAPFAVVIGLVAGVSTCMAVVGGLVLGISARFSEQHPNAPAWRKFRPHLLFNLGRISGYAVFGGILGALGGALKLSNGMLAILTVAVGFVMLLLGMKLTGISPRLKQTSITLPSALGRWFGLNKAGGVGTRSALLTGALTFSLPCGFTQAMQLYAISTGSFSRGALALGFFALGTAPALLSAAGLISIVKGAFARRFYTTVGLAVLVFGFVNIRNGLALTGITSGFGGSPKAVATATIEGGVQTVRMTQNGGGYSPKTFTVTKGVPVKWIITSTNSYTCAAFLVMPKYNIRRDLQEGENVIEFTPTETGTVPFSCSMGMYRGSFTVVDGGVSSARPSGKTGIAPATPKSGSTVISSDPLDLNLVRHTLEKKNYELSDDDHDA